jgi:soluble lytic murein transglycosylase-like protein
MSLTRRVPLRCFFKFAPFTIIGLFLFTNLTGLLFNTVLAPTAQATGPETDYAPSDVPSSGDVGLDRAILRAGERYGVDPRFIHAVIWKESNYDPAVTSRRGAQGPMQLMPGTAHRFGCDKPGDAASNVSAGTRYLRWLLQRFDGNVELALAGYNAGEGAVDKYQGVPPFGETQQYVRVVTARYGKTFHPVLNPKEALAEFHLTPDLAGLNP